MKPASPITVLVADDSSLWVTALRETLATTADVRIVGSAADGEAAVRETERLRPQVVLMDVLMPVLGGLEALLGRLRATTASRGTPEFAEQAAGDDSPTVRAILKAFIAPLVEVKEAHPHFPALLGRVLHENLMLGTPDEVIEKLKPYEALGVDEFTYYCNIGTSMAERKRSLELFINEIMPAFADTSDQKAAQ